MILRRNRWLLLFGAFINAMVVLFFFNMYQDRPAVVLSSGGLISKLAQFLLEVALIYVIIAIWNKGKNAPREYSHKGRVAWHPILRKPWAEPPVHLTTLSEWTVETLPLTG